MASPAELIRAARLERGWSQQDLAKAVAVGLRQVNRWESGRQTPSQEVAERLAEALGLPLDTLTGTGGGEVLLVVAEPDVLGRLIEQGLSTPGYPSYTRPEHVEQARTHGSVAFVRVAHVDEETRARVDALG